MRDRWRATVTALFAVALALGNDGCEIFFDLSDRRVGVADASPDSSSGGAAGMGGKVDSSEGASGGRADASVGSGGAATGTGGRTGSAGTGGTDSSVGFGGAVSAGGAAGSQGAAGNAGSTLTATCLEGATVTSVGTGNCDNPFMIDLSTFPPGTVVGHGQAGVRMDATFTQTFGPTCAALPRQDVYLVRMPSSQPTLEVSVGTAMGGVTKIGIASVANGTTRCPSTLPMDLACSLPDSICHGFRHTPNPATLTRLVIVGTEALTTAGVMFRAPAQVADAALGSADSAIADRAAVDGTSQDAATLVTCPASAPAGACPVEGIVCPYQGENCACSGGIWSCTACPAAQPSPGSSCTDLRLDCKYGSLTCSCSATYIWSCGLCPAAPASGSVCGNSSIRCFYGNMECDCSDTWSCLDITPSCPAPEPTVVRAGICSSWVCLYGSEACLGCSTSSGSALAFYGCMCPASQPAEGSPCVAVVNVDSSCHYGEVACSCEAARWTCQPSCPSNQPDVGGACTTSGLNCSYATAFCSCTGADAGWSCTGGGAD